jgi:hypothetical protein
MEENWTNANENKCKAYNKKIKYHNQKDLQAMAVQVFVVKNDSLVVFEQQ